MLLGRQANNYKDFFLLAKIIVWTRERIGSDSQKGNRGFRKLGHVKGDRCGRERANSYAPPRNTRVAQHVLTQ